MQCMEAHLASKVASTLVLEIGTGDWTKLLLYIYIYIVHIY
jgi:hypothetical protein